MPRKTLASFKVEYQQLMNEKGDVDEKVAAIDPEFAKRCYELMTLVRVFDAKAVAMQRQGRIGTYASVLGQEAAQVGSALALQESDYLLPTYREAGALIARDSPMHQLLQYFGGDERGSAYEEGINNFPIAIPISSQIPHATGIGWAMRLKGHKAAALVYFGDGASSRGDFHEAINIAAVMKANAVFFCQNNQYAISLPRERQTLAESIAQKAISYGVEGLQVDGNDVLGVHKAVSDALQKAYTGKGPTLIEAYTFRLGDHTTSDDAKKYRDPKLVEQWQKRDPLARLRVYLRQKMLWDEDYEKSLLERCAKKVEDAVVRYESTPAAPLTDMFDYHYAQLPQNLAEQRREVM
ncbi:pyruvate dehydrogenase (acetyl-transferring) E1 component subunit alpha [Candidatus Woesearchaeota archaeon CG1_02_57_44]|nr:MAG: pyruvate dehydrogenase (acetyl-transferring) E1 component subunit alpha [Candidatus Woesearchaeota archaeon CG1_02_57_44]